MNLYDAWLANTQNLVPQVQGDCGVFSFWYATVLLRQIEPAHRPVIYPRKHPSPGTAWPGGTVGQSIREYAKLGVRSGQGEVLTRVEMEKIITHFGYKCVSSTGGGTLIRKNFIAGALARNQPVMFPYTKGNTGPVDATTATGRPGTDFGSHWSLIIHERAGDYVYLDPHYPSIPQLFNKDLVLRSNANVDSQKYVRYWGKDQPGGLAQIGPILAPVGTFIKIYDIGQGGRDQNLKNVLIAVQ